MANKSTYELQVKLGASTSQSWTATLSKAEEGLEGLNSTANAIVAGIAAGVTAAAATATMAISNAVETYKGFEQEMATVRSISEATDTEYLAMKEAAMDAGQSTIYTAEEAASALEYMSLAGWSVQDSIEGLSPMLKMAAATGQELQTTSDLVTDSMSALGVGIDGLDAYMDKLITANNNSNTTATQLMEALIKTGGASKVLGVSLDDTITSLGVLANNGTKAEEAGTALNAIFVRLAGNSQAIKQMKGLGISIWDDNGEFIGWQESLETINAAMADLTDEEQAQALKNLAGTTHYSQMQYLLDAVKENADGTATAWDELEAQVEDSNGALGRMYETTTDTLENAEAKLNSAKEDMQIRLVDVFSDDAKDFVTWLAESLPKVTSLLVDFAEAHKKDFADMVEGVEDGIETLWENGITALEWIMDNKKAITGTIKAVAAEIVAVKAALAGVKIAQLLTNPLTAVPAVAALAGVAIGAIAGHLEDVREAAKDADLESRFGSISMSLSDLESAADHIIGSGSLTGVLEALEQFGELDAYQEEMEEAVEALNKYDWKVSIGMELTEDEQEDYKGQIESYVKAAQDYALQTEYAVSLSMAITFNEDDLEQSNIVSKVNGFYADKYAQLEELGTRLNKAVTDAFNDGLLDIDEVKEISELQRQMADIQSQLAVGELDAQLALLEQDYSGIALDPSSYEELEEVLADKVSGAMETYDQAFVYNYQAVTNAYENGEGENAMTEDEYNAAIDELNRTRAGQKAQAEMKAITFELNTINSGFAEEIGIYNNAVSDAIEKYAGQDTAWEESPWAMWTAVADEVKKNGIDSASRDAIAELLEKMQPNIDYLYGLVEDDWYNLDSGTQEAVTEAVRNVETLQAMTVGKNDGDTRELYRDIANRAAEAQDGGNVTKYALENYGELTEYGLSNDIDDYADYVEKTTNQPFNVTGNAETTVKPEYEIEDGDRSLYGAGFGYYSSYDTSYDEKAVDEAIENADEYAKGQMLESIEGAYAWSEDKIEEYFSQGFETTADLDVDITTYLRFANQSLVSKADELLGNTGGTTGLLQKANELFGINSTGTSVGTGTDGTVNVGMHALGGIVTRPELTWVAEAGDSEAIIPINSTKRAAGLWYETGRMLGLISGDGPGTQNGTAKAADMLDSAGGTSVTDSVLRIMDTMPDARDGTRDEGILMGITGGDTVQNTQNMQISFNPVINIQGSATREDVDGAMSLTLDRLRDMMEEIQRENQRVTFG